MFPYKRLSVSFATALSTAAIAPILIAQSSLPAKAANFSKLYAFGDSLVDTGNAFAQTGIPPAPYFEGRFSNGPVWTEYLASGLGISETSLGFGGASSGEAGLLRFGGGAVSPVPGTLAQVNDFINDSASVDPEGLYVVWAGANDYLFGQQANPLEPVGNISKAVADLSAAGAKDFLLVNLPNLGDVPLLDVLNAEPETVAGLNALSNGHNQALAAVVDQFNASDDINVDLLDSNSLFESVVAGNFGAFNTTDACTLTPECLNNPDVQASYLFWDEVHPTTAAHQILSEGALALLKDDAVVVPEPALGYVLVMVGGWSLSRLKRKSSIS